MSAQTRVRRGRERQGAPRPAWAGSRVLLQRPPQRDCPPPTPHPCALFALAVVGNQMMRGISGGQRKRVTSGEALVGHAKVLYADEISTGLDSNTTHQARAQKAHGWGWLVAAALGRPAGCALPWMPAAAAASLHALHCSPPCAADHKEPAELLPRHERECIDVHCLGEPAPEQAMVHRPASAACSLQLSREPTAALLPRRLLNPQSTMLVALLQPAPETFELFDDVMLLASGMVRESEGGAGGMSGFARMSRAGKAALAAAQRQERRLYLAHTDISRPIKSWSSPCPALAHRRCCTTGPPLA